MPDGRLAAVDFEEAGARSALLAAGHFLAHLRSPSRRRSGRRAADRLPSRIQAGHASRFGWAPRELALCEAVAHLRLSTNPLSNPGYDVSDRIFGRVALMERSPVEGGGV